MKRNEFNEMCLALLISPDIALESEVVRDALKNNAGREEIFEILTEELIISQADYDFIPTDEKLDHISSLEIKILEALR